MERELSPSEAAAVIGTTTVAHATSTAARRSAPTQILIPKIGVDASVVGVGIGKSGNMAVPTKYADAGWYRYGPSPGEEGSAVIDGHVDNGFGLPAVFKRLSELQAGDEVFIVRADGSKLHFVVRTVTIYDLKDVPLGQIFNAQDGAYVNLITCDGTWSKESLSYDKRLVVHAELVR
jgi:sortase A